MIDKGELTRAILGLLVDAMRYQWVRQAGAWESEVGLDALSKDPEKFDAAVDEMIARDRR